MKPKAEERTAEDTRNERLEDRLDKLEPRLSEEIRQRQQAEAAHRLTMSLREAINVLVQWRLWAAAVAEAPPPALPDLKRLRAVLSDDPPAK